jgi:HD-GYP domain-containing protein (c-di-GMP phosphodiesterase class II)
MTTDRSYRKALRVDEAVAELRRCSGTDFDPAVVDALISQTA